MILLMANDVLAHAQIKEGYQRMSLPIVFILLLSCRLVIYYQEIQRQKAALEEKQQNSTAKATDAKDETKKTK